MVVTMNVVVVVCGENDYGYVGGGDKCCGHGDVCGCLW
jgi:hypothetical protein